jgi:hypothetical protein
MNNSSILNIGIITYPDVIYISPNHCVEPYGTMIAHSNITYYGAVFG